MNPRGPHSQVGNTNTLIILKLCNVWYVIFEGETRFGSNGKSRKSSQKGDFWPGLEWKVEVHWGVEVQGISGGRTTETTHQSTEENDVFGESRIAFHG